MSQPFCTHPCDVRFHDDARGEEICTACGEVLVELTPVPPSDGIISLAGRTGPAPSAAKSKALRRALRLERISLNAKEKRLIQSIGRLKEIGCDSALRRLVIRKYQSLWDDGLEIPARDIMAFYEEPDALPGPYRRIIASSACPPAILQLSRRLNVKLVSACRFLDFVNDAIRGKKGPRLDYRGYRYLNLWMKAEGLSAEILKNRGEWLRDPVIIGKLIELLEACGC